MEPSAFRDLFRSHMRDTAEPYLWEDDEIDFYATVAQTDFVRKTGGLNDSKSSITRISLVPGVAEYRMSPTILKVKTAVRVDGRALIRENDTNIQFDEDRLRERGVVNTLLIGVHEGLFRVYPVPDETEAGKVIQLTVLRTPLEPCGTCFEISEYHIPHLLSGVYAQALLKNDAETYNPARADQYQRMFDMYCDRSYRERRRLEHSPREVKYGGL